MDGHLDELLTVKATDYKINSGIMPKKNGIYHKFFAQSLGASAGKVLCTYDEIFQLIKQNLPTDKIQARIKRRLSNSSKVNVNVPFLKPKTARICGLVALNHCGFFDSEINLYSAIADELSYDDGPESLSKKCESIAASDKPRYSKLLSEKQESIEHFEILMGFTKDNQRIASLKENMNSDLSDYFDKVITMHEGKMGITCPLFLKSFTGTIEQGLRRDSISYHLQKGTGSDHGFSLPENSAYHQMISQIVQTLRDISPNSKSSLYGKWKSAAALPTTLFFLSSMNAYCAQNNFSSNGQSEMFTPMLLASTSAYTTANDMNQFITTFGTSFFSSLSSF